VGELVDGTLDLSGDVRPRGVPVTISPTAAHVAASMGVWRYYRMRVAGDADLCRVPQRADRCWYDAIIGALGEMALAVHLRLKWFPTLGPDGDWGDVGGWQVKTTVWQPLRTIRTAGPHLIIPSQETTPRPYVLVHGDGFTRWQIAGWLPADEARQSCWLVYEQGRPAYWIPASQLRSWPPAGDGAAAA